MKWIYPILGDQKRLPVYLSGIGIAEPEYHVCRNQGLLKNAVQHMEEHYAKDISLEELAQKSGVTKQHFCRVFREQKAWNKDDVIKREILSSRKMFIFVGKQNYFRLFAIRS